MSLTGESKPLAAGRYYYHWIIAVCCTLVTFINGGIFFTFSVFFKPVASDFGWNRGDFSLNYAVMLIAYAPGAFFAGKLADRRGPRGILLLAALLIGLGFLGCNRVNNLGFMIISYALIGLGLGATLALPTATIQRWFIRFRATMVGVVNAGNGIGGLVFAPLANYLIAVYGWRSAYLIVGIIFFGVIAIAALFLVAEPRMMGLKPFGYEKRYTETADHSQQSLTPSISLSQAFKIGTFWGMAAICVLTFMPAFFIAAHLIPYVTDKGISAAVGAQALGLMTGTSVIGRLVMSWVAGRIGWTKTLTICYIIASGCVVWLVFVDRTESLYLLMVVYGLSYGSTLALIGGAVGYFFGLSSLSELLGFLLGIGVLFAAILPWLGGFIFDLTSSYVIAMAIAAGLFAVAGILSSLMKPPRL
ncbi:MFS transporter [Chloroflexota bacterium]